MPIEYSYDANSSNNTKLEGEWNVRYEATSGSKKVTIVPALQVCYTYEYGD